MSSAIAKKNTTKSKAATKGRVLVAMSGGVDSSVAAALLVNQGYEVVGATMQVWDYSDCNVQEGHGTCCSSIDVEDARAVADKIGIPFYVLNCESHFKKNVIDNFIDSYLSGKTPIPCVQCNTYLKFDHLISKMKELDCDYLATGHYAKIKSNPKDGSLSILTSTDDWKDQTYFLFTINSGVIPHLMFPVGDLKKPELRKMAEEMGLPVAHKKDSTGICFVGKNDYSDFVDKHSNVSDHTKGVLKLHPTGEILGDHQGIHHFTCGQRKGLGVSYSDPLYVVRIEADTGVVWLGLEKHLYGNELDITNGNWIGNFDDGEKLRVKIRFQHKGALAQVYKKDKKISVKFDEPQRSITPGQAAVFYRDQRLLGGGWIL